MAALTIGIPTYNDFDGAYFTLQALRRYQDLEDTELLVVDNFGCEHTRQFVEGSARARYILATEAVGTAAAKNRVFAEAQGEAVLCCDSHVLFVPGTIARLKAYYREHPETIDLLQGPLLADDLTTVFTHHEPIWRDELWGTWATDPRGLEPEAEPFDIPMQGMGVFSCRKDAWPGYNPAFRGFGGEEGYIHEKFRRAGARCLCLPWLRWGHRFARPAGVPYPVLLHDKVKNYIIGFTEVGLDLEPVRNHFSARLPDEEFATLVSEALAEAQTIAAISPAATSDAVSLGNASAAVEPGPVPATDPQVPTEISRRAIVSFVEDKPHLIQQFLALRMSWLYAQSPDTDLVVFGPKKVLADLPDDVVKIAQEPAADNPVWRDYRYINTLACLNGTDAEQLDRYSHILRTDADTFITPAWNTFSPATFTYGLGTYANDDDVRQKLQALAAIYGLTHRGKTNIGSSWYGPTAVVRRAAAVAELLTKHLLNDDFVSDPGQWPGWYRGVAIKYAGEIAVNHCAPDAQRSDLLDAPSDSTTSIEHYPHIHCWHTDQPFSKHVLMNGGYTLSKAETLDMDIIRDYCLAFSLLSRDVMTAVRM